MPTRLTSGVVNNSYFHTQISPFVVEYQQMVWSQRTKTTFFRQDCTLIVRRVYR